MRTTRPREWRPRPPETHAKPPGGTSRDRPSHALTPDRPAGARARPARRPSRSLHVSVAADPPGAASATGAGLIGTAADAGGDRPLKAGVTVAAAIPTVTLVPVPDLDPGFGSEPAGPRPTAKLVHEREPRCDHAASSRSFCA